MSGATIFRMPAAFARDNYPIVRDGAAPAGRPAEGGRSSGASDKGTPTASAGNEHQVTTEFKSLLGGGGGRRTATA